MTDLGLGHASIRARARFAGIALVLVVACGPAEGPQPIVYDREPCFHCRMLISEPHFAAQLQTGSGEILSFDDPGCLLATLAASTTPPRAIWFHHVREERWLDAAHVAFEPNDKTPMGYGLGAVDAGTPGALGFDEARLRIESRGARPEDRP